MSSAPDRVRPAPASNRGGCLCLRGLGMLQRQVMRLEKSKLGSTGFNATVLGIGDLADRSVPLAKGVATIHRAMDFGLNLIDTAPGYEDGYSEAIVGAALRGRYGGFTSGGNTGGIRGLEIVRDNC